ncbi:MAG: iron-sulfur cluster assembly accessory protein [Proteobacteria bacterium]|nr:iron-sulfur cluster assembly accessory protein [Pseudomonadota bacterium]MBU1710629.1 iron-sulfur cluster assembly accessory protein [Pseudomonadota bacterium]
MNITIMDKAATMLNNKLESGQFVRVGVAEGGCAGLTYSAEIAGAMKDNEGVVHTAGGIRIVSDEKSSKFLDGLVIDFSDDLINGGLKFTNSNTRTTCGCGQSFNLAGFPKIEGGKCK